MANGNGSPKSNSKIYNTIIRVLDKFIPQPLRPLWVHAAGPQTIFFWAPLIKWGIVIAGLGDLLRRPAELISISQCVALAMTCFIWARYSLVIIPKNLNLFSVNISVGLINCYLL